MTVVELLALLNKQGITLSVDGSDLRISAPKDKKTTRARINWILRQLGGTDSPDVFVSAVWPGRAARTQCSLLDALADPQMLGAGTSDLKPQAFEVQLIRDLAGKMSGMRTFIESVEIAVPELKYARR